ncbi:DUF4097 domain-containing protein [Natronomonas gomsonensis]|uniref:hypothetical protein n=1 Tax=Natronomonas gomsonensis TaxID=1046043 RepID=UPI00227D2CFC|nr:hypothetical protein [Natronomonas gomsonensis]MCY4732533.1 DUF4097 domain-containing protein [Natronomonas gomsonensis]
MQLLDAFADDTRAVAPLVGFILLFGLFVVAFSGYQASAVPQQNAETELQHYQDVQNDLTVVRNAISRAGQQHQRQFESVRLGTAYRERVLALNPPSPAGDLRTSDKYDITIQRGDGTQVIDPVSTRFLEYRNQYHELDIDAIRYEHSVLYLTDAGGAESAVFEEQNLVQRDGTVTVTALQEPFSASSTGRATVELYPTRSAPEELPPGQLTVTLPTRLSADYWETALEGRIAADKFEIRDDDTYPDGVRALELQVDSEDLEFNTVGINAVPDGFRTPDTGSGGGDTGGGGPSDSPSTGPGDCSVTDYEDASGDVTISAGESVGDISTDGDVTLKPDAEACTITAGGDVELKNRAGAGDISADGSVTLKPGSTAEDILDAGSVTLEDRAEAGSITARGGVELKVDTVSGDISTSDGGVTLGNRAATGSISATGDTSVGTDATSGAISTTGGVTVDARGDTGAISASGDVELKEEAVSGDIATDDGGVTLKKRATAGSIEATGDVVLEQGATAGDITTDGDVTLKTRAEAGFIDAGGDVELKENATAENY